MHDQQFRHLLFGALIAMAVMAAVSLVLGRVLAGHVLRPLRMITAATRRISAENLDQRLAVAGPDDEVKELADTMDGLLARLGASFAAQRRFVANASHELRTPLTTIRASLDVAVAKPDPAPQTLALAGRPRAEAIAAKGLTVEDGVRANARTLGSPALLSRLVQNLIDKAIVHNQEGGWIRIATEGGADGEGDGGGGGETVGAGTEVRLVVETGGRVLDQAEVDRPTQPFERLGADRTGSQESSGLSIVAAIVAAHGGGLDLRVRPEGGLRVVATMPAVTP